MIFTIQREENQINGFFGKYGFSCEIAVSNEFGGNSNYDIKLKQLNSWSSFVLDDILLSRNFIQFQFRVDLIEYCLSSTNIKPMESIEYKLNLIKDMENLLVSATRYDSLLMSANGKISKVHGAILASRSDVFQTQLTEGTFQKISTCNDRVMNKFLKYLYCGMLADVGTSELRDLIFLFEKYKINEGCKIANQLMKLQ